MSKQRNFESDENKVGEYRINPYALPSETSLRFFLLMLSALTLVITIYTFFASTINQSILEPMNLGQSALAPLDQFIVGVSSANQALALDSNGQFDPQLFAEAKEILELVVKDNLFIPMIVFGGILLFLVASFIIYRFHPVVLRYQNSYQLADESNSDAAEVVEYVKDLTSSRSNLQTPSIEFGKSNSSAEGQVFGFNQAFRIGFLGSPFTVKQYKVIFPQRLKSIVLHELAHIKHRDVWRFHFARSTGTSVLWIAIVPWLVYLLWLFSPPLLSEATDDITLALFFKETIPLFLWFALQVSFFSGLAYLVLLSVLRIREYYADWQADVWGGGEGLLELITPKRPNSSEGNKGWIFGQQWKMLLEMHPADKDRRVTLQNPASLFKASKDIPIVAGILLAGIVSGLMRLLGSTWIQFRGRTLLFLINIAETSNGIETPFSQIVRLLIGRLFPALLLIVLIVGVGYVISGTVGRLIQRNLIYDLYRPSEDNRIYLRLLGVAFLLGIGFEIGILLTPLSVLKPQALTASVLLLPVLMLLFVGISWLWLVSVRMNSDWLLSRFFGLEPPKVALSILTVVSAVTYSSILPLMITSHLLVVSPFIVEDLGSEVILFASGLVLAALVIALATLLVGFFILWLLAIVIRRHQTDCCSECGHKISPLQTIADMCSNCQKPLASWLFTRVISE